MTKFLKFVGVFVVIFATFVLFAFYGNPISQLLVTKNAKDYLQENYPNTDFKIETVNYDFKTSDYYVCVVSPSSADSRFEIGAGLNGKIGYDTYEDAVVKKWNTAGRINDEYREAVDAVFNNPEFPYDSDIGFGDIDFTTDDFLDYAFGTLDGPPEYAIKTETLELDEVYDINEFGKKAGHITIYVYDEDVSYERLAEILLGIRNILDEADVSFYVIDCVLEYPRPEDDGEWKEGRVEVMSFLYDDIYEEGLTERVRISDEKAKAYYAELDKLK